MLAQPAPFLGVTDNATTFRACKVTPETAVRVRGATESRSTNGWHLPAGLVLVSSMLMLASLAMFSFPKRLSTSRPTPRALRREKKNPSLRGESGRE